MLEPVPDSVPKRIDGNSERCVEIEEEERNNDCSVAADLISLFTGATQHEIRASLGCAPGTNCQVDDDVVSDAIIKLSDSK